MIIIEKEERNGHEWVTIANGAAIRNEYTSRQICTHKYICAFVFTEDNEKFLFHLNINNVKKQAQH